MAEKTYYDWLFGESEEEKEIQRRIDEENARYKNTDAFQEHKTTLNGLLDELKIAGEKRRKEAEKHRPKRRRKLRHLSDEEMAERKRQGQEIREQRIEALPEDLKSVIRSYEALPDEAKKAFKQETYFYVPDYDDYKDPVTTEKDMKELLEILVQTTIDFVNERGLTDIYSVSFGADDLQGSAKFGEWAPCTDASIGVNGIGKEKGRDGNEYDVLQKIGFYM